MTENPYATDEYWKDRAITGDEGPEAQEGDAFDAFSPDNIGVVQFITQARIYDVLMAILEDTAPDKHRELLEAHAKGLILTPSPVFQGVFVTDEINQSLQD